MSEDNTELTNREIIANWKMLEDNNDWQKIVSCQMAEDNDKLTKDKSELTYDRL